MSDDLRPDGATPDPEQVFAGLRHVALTVTPEALGLDPSSATPVVLGVLMELGTPKGTATVASLADGTTSLYTSTGGGRIGGGAHEQVAAATRRLVALAEEHLDLLSPSLGFPLPAPGFVAFQVVSRKGARSASAPEAALADRSHPLWPLYFGGQDVITRLRMIDEPPPTG